MPVPFRRRAVLALTAAAVLGVAGCTSGGSGDSGAAGSPADDRSTYLALGDSVPFGFRAHESPGVYADPDNFTGYPELVGRSRDLDVVNTACPGETTASFLDASAQSNGCENTADGGPGFRDASPLHVDYASPTQSQVDLAVDTLKKRRDVELVTLQVGANDAFLCQQASSDGCLSGIGTVASTVGANIGTILQRLRTDGGYTGRVVVVTYYALDYADLGTALATQLLDDAITKAAQAQGATVASGWDAFKPTAQASGGDSIAAGLVRTDDVHPTAKGQQLLADAVEQALDG